MFQLPPTATTTYGTFRFGKTLRRPVPSETLLPGGLTHYTVFFLKFMFFITALERMTVVRRRHMSSFTLYFIESRIIEIQANLDDVN